MECVRVLRVMIGEGSERSELLGDADADLGDAMLFVDNPFFSGVVAMIFFIVK